MRAALLVLALSASLAVPPAAQTLPDWARPTEPDEAPLPTYSALPPTVPGGGTTPSQVPVDGGIGLLALLGGAYAARRLRAR